MNTSSRWPILETTTTRSSIYWKPPIRINLISLLRTYRLKSLTTSKRGISSLRSTNCCSIDSYLSPIRSGPRASSLNIQFRRKYTLLSMRISMKVLQKLSLKIFSFLACLPRSYGWRSCAHRKTSLWLTLTFPSEARYGWRYRRFTCQYSTFPWSYKYLSNSFTVC